MSIPNPERRMVVLAIEDEPLVRMFIADFLDEARFKVIEAVNADEATTILRARPDIQAVVTDIEMLGSMNGLELARLIQERWPGIGVVVTSGRERPGPDDLSEKVAFLSPTFPSLSSMSSGRWPHLRSLSPKKSLWRHLPKDESFALGFVTSAWDIESNI
jgi:CheY-like chemotaxis protein